MVETAPGRGFPCCVALCYLFPRRTMLFVNNFAVVNIDARCSVIRFVVYFYNLSFKGGEIIVLLQCWIVQVENWTWYD